MSAVLPHLVAKVDADFRKGDLDSARKAQDTLNKWYAVGRQNLLCTACSTLQQASA